MLFYCTWNHTIVRVAVKCQMHRLGLLQSCQSAASSDTVSSPGHESDLCAIELITDLLFTFCAHDTSGITLVSFSRMLLSMQFFFSQRWRGPWNLTLASPLALRQCSIICACIRNYHHLSVMLLKRRVVDQWRHSEVVTTKAVGS